MMDDDGGEWKSDTNQSNSGEDVAPLVKNPTPKFQLVQLSHQLTMNQWPSGSVPAP